MRNESSSSYSARNKRLLSQSSSLNELEIQTFLEESGRRLNRQLAKRNSVILPNSGEKVHRSSSFFNSEFESFNDDTINESVYSGSAVSVTTNTSHRHRIAVRLSEAKERLIRLSKSDTFRNVIKCGVSYLIASMAVYFSPFSRALGQTDSKHVAATTSVYFHPARTKGSMHQSILFVLLSLSFVFLLSVSCRSVSAYFFKIGEDQISYSVDLIVSSIGLGIIAFMKQKINKDTFNTACSLASISLVTCIVKEGSLNSHSIPMYRLLSTSEVALVGSSVSVVVCYLLWPKSAVEQLRLCLNDSFNAMSSLVSVITHRFVKEEKISKKDFELFMHLRKKSNEMSKYLEEAKYELYLVGKESEYILYCEIVDATNSMIEHLSALKSSCEMQAALLAKARSDGLRTGSDNSDQESIPSLFSFFSSTVQVSQPVENMESTSFQNSKFQNSEMHYNVEYSTQLFDLFVYYLAPSIRSFVFTIKEVLRAVPFEKKFMKSGKQTFFAESIKFQESLNKAIKLYEEKQSLSFDKIYSQKTFETTDFQFKTDQEEVAACCGNFSCLLALFGKQLIKFLQLTDQFEVQAKNSQRSWCWAKFWNRKASDKSEKKSKMLEAEFLDAIRELKSQLKANPKGNDENSSLLQRRDTSESFRFKLWRSFSVFRRTDVQFGVRVGVGAFCISLFAFLPHTQAYFVHYRLEWALAIYCIMMNKSLGGTTITAKWRFVGTFVGAFIAYLAWQVSDANEIVLALTGFMLSLPCFYIIIYWKRNNAYGRFILLAYNLTALYSYSMVQKDSEDSDEGGDNPIVGEIAFHRFLAVSLGIAWALMVTAFFLPNSARARLKSGLTILWLRMGVVWYSDPMDYRQSPEGSRLTGLKDLKGTRDLLLECQALVKQAPVEFRLKGTFPKEIYEKLLVSTSAILDAFSNLQHLVEVDHNLDPNEESVLKYVESERDELEHRIFLIFYMVASALSLGFPLPAKPASTEHAMDRMLLKLNEFRSCCDQVKLSNEDYVMLYSYILVTSKITLELDKILNCIKELLGDISEDIFLLV